MDFINNSMRYFKKITIKNYNTIVQKSKRYVLGKLNYSSVEMVNFQKLVWTDYLTACPEILKAFSSYDLTPVNVSVYSLAVLKECPLHIDYISDKHHKCRINIPLLNCEHSKTYYYKFVKDKYSREPLYQPNGFSYIKLKVDDPALEKVDYVVVDRPTIIRVQEPHRVVINENYVPRVVLTFDFDKDPVYLLEDETC